VRFPPFSAVCADCSAPKVLGLLTFVEGGAKLLWLRMFVKVASKRKRNPSRMQDRKQLRIVSSSKTNRNKVNAPTATDSQLVDMGQRTKRFESSLDYSERIAYERIARALTPRKRV
jgi:hypothetical protein